MKVVVFDLDDTLYKEIDFLKSAYHEIAETIGHSEAYDLMLNFYQAGENVFERVIEQFHLSSTIDQLLKTYRIHKPEITLEDSAVATLNSLKERGAKMCLLTDGRSVTQRNKIESLGLYRWIDPEDILISEEFGHGKPEEQCYRYFINRYLCADFIAVGDNVSKDFITPNRLGWSTVCLLDNGQNIHKQNFELDEEFLPQLRIRNINQLIE